jgi:hypothetical protein
MMLMQAFRNTMATPKKRVNLKRVAVHSIADRGKVVDRENGRECGLTDGPQA